MGPVTWLLTAEVYPVNIRAKANAVTVCCNRIAAAVVSMSYLSLGARLGRGGTWVLFASMTLCITTFVVLLVPETKGRTLEEMRAYFEAIARGDVDDTDGIASTPGDPANVKPGLQLASREADQRKRE